MDVEVDRLHASVLKKEVKDSSRRVHTSRSRLPQDLLPCQAEEMEQDWKPDVANTPAEDQHLLDSDAKYSQMRDALHHFEDADENLFGRARERAFYSALRKALYNCVTARPESRRTASINATHKWFLKSQPEDTEQSMRPTVSVLRTANGRHAFIRDPNRQKGEPNARIKQVCKIGGEAPPHGEIYSGYGDRLELDSCANSPVPNSVTTGHGGVPSAHRKSISPPEHRPGWTMATGPSMRSTPTPDLTEDSTARGGWSRAASESSARPDKPRKRRVAQLEQNAREQITMCKISAAGDDAEFAIMQQRWLEAQTIQTKYMMDVEEALSRWSAHRARVEEEISRRREATRFAAPFPDRVPQSTLHLYLSTPAATHPEGEHRNDPTIDELSQMKAMCLSPYARNSYMIGKRAGGLRSEVIIESVDEAARISEKLGRMGIASKEVAESALNPVPDKPRGMCEILLPKPGEFAPPADETGKRSGSPKGKRKSRKKSGRKKAK
ncbi:hypothetical protein BSKO_06426 [Bryopsis sp. KO-2023]|nr:hypothetical protein BSKO_06426 [Bryopsis sp. KO-2023]